MSIGDSREVQRAGDVCPRARVHLSGTIVRTWCLARTGRASVVYVIEDGTGEIDLVFLGRRTIPGLVRGGRLTVQGTAGLMNERIVVINPRYEILGCSCENPAGGSWI